MIAIDVGAEDNNELTNYGDYVSGWYCLWNKINPFSKKIRVCPSTHNFVVLCRVPWSVCIINVCVETIIHNANVCM